MYNNLPGLLLGLSVTCLVPRKVSEAVTRRAHLYGMKNSHFRFVLSEDTPFSLMATQTLQKHRESKDGMMGKVCDILGEAYTINLK